MNKTSLNEKLSSKQLIEDLKSYVDVDNEIFHNLKNKINRNDEFFEKSDVIKRLNYSINSTNIIFHNLKNQIEYEYEFFEENIREVNQLIEKGRYHYAMNILDYLDEFIFSLRKNIY